MWIIGARVASAKGLRLQRTLLVGFLVGIGTVLVTGPLRIPGRDLHEVVYPLLPVALAFAWVATDAVFAEVPLELRHRFRTVRRRAALLATMVVAMASAGFVALLDNEAQPLVLFRNGVLFVSLAALLQRRQSAALVVLVMYCAATWLLGSNGAGQSPQWWALPLFPIGSVGAAFATLVASLAAFMVPGRRFLGS